MEHYNVVIVGAGFWGLCAARTFLLIDPSLSLIIIDDKDTVGGVWSLEQIYPGLRSNNLQGYYEFSDFPMLDAELGIQPRGILPGETIQAYLQKYAENFGLVPRIRLQTEVIRARERQGASVCWEIELRNSKDKRSLGNISCNKLVVATGQASIPNTINLNGLKEFTKPVFHSVDLAKYGPSLLADSTVKEVAVIGGSKSAHDAAYMFGTAGKHVTWIIHQPGRGRRPVPMTKTHVSIGSFSIWAESLLLFRPFTWFGAAAWSKGDGFSWVRWFLHGTKWGNALVKGYYEGNAARILEQSGILDDEKTKVLVPDASMLWYGTQLNALNYDEDFYKLIRDYKVSIVQAEIDHLVDDKVVLESGTSIQIDVLVAAIGYDYSASISLEPVSRRLDWGCPVDPAEDTTYPALDARADTRLFAQFPMLKDSPPQRERPPLRTPWRLWRFMAAPSQVATGQSRNLVFLSTIICYQMTIKNEITSLWAYAYLYDKLAVRTPSRSEVQEEIAYWTRFGKWRTPFGIQGKVAEFTHDAMPYYDLLLRDLGLRSWRKGWGILGEIFGGPYRVQDYKGIVQEWINSQERKTARERKEI